jgi:hypothetical protein
VAYKDGSSTALSTSTNGTLSITLSTQKPTKSIRCVMYYGTSGTVVLDEETVNVVKDGTDGADGRSITATTIAYAKTTSLVSDPSTITGWSPNLPTVTQQEYLWTRTLVSYSTGDPTASYTYSYQGKNGTAGTSVTVSKIEYQSGTSSTTAPTGTWSTSIPTVS